MDSRDIELKDGGWLVTCRIFARSLLPAQSAHLYADENPPIGYILLRASIARRKKGGKARFLRLTYQYTGKSPMPPMCKWEEWDATLEEEQRIAKGTHNAEVDNRDFSGEQREHG